MHSLTHAVRSTQDGKLFIHDGALAHSTHQSPAAAIKSPEVTVPGTPAEGAPRAEPAPTTAGWSPAMSIWELLTDPQAQARHGIPGPGAAS
jgi:hypothetical protein